MSTATGTQRETTRIFVVGVDVRLHELGFYTHFCFCGGGGRGLAQFRAPLFLI